MKDYDVAVIGAGVIGCFIAKELSKYDLKVVVLEREPSVGMGPTKGCSGIIHPFQLPFNSLKGKLCLEGNKMMDDEAKELGFKFKRVGLILIARNRISNIIIRLIKFYFSRYLRVEYLPRSKIISMEPNVTEEVCGGLFFPDAGVVNPVEMTFRARRFAELNGVEFRFEREVTGIERERDFFKITSETDGRETITSRYVINCAGLYADEIAGMIGDFSFKIEPGKGAHVIFDDRDFTYHIMAAIPLKPDRKTKGGGALVTIDGNIIWGPSLVDASDKEDRSVNVEDVKRLIEKHSKVFKEMPKKPIAVYSGVRAMAGKDFIINSPVKNFINVAGIQSPGLTAAPAIAKLVLRILRNSGLELKNKPYKSDAKKDVNIFKKVIFTGEREIPYFIEDELVCHCNLVTFQEINDTIDDGASTFDEIKHLTGCSMGCRKCMPDVIEIMHKRGLKLRKDFKNSYIVWK
jgi:glycerol-3-phosphate dehydrogenase